MEQSEVRQRYAIEGVIFHETVLHHIAKDELVADVQGLRERIGSDDITRHTAFAAEDVNITLPLRGGVTGSC